MVSRQKIPYRLFAALKIGRLAICRSYQGRNVGSILILIIVGLADKLSEKIGIRFVSLDAYEQSVGLYKK